VPDVQQVDFLTSLAPHLPYAIPRGCWFGLEARQLWLYLARHAAGQLSLCQASVEKGASLAQAYQQPIGGALGAAFAAATQAPAPLLGKPKEMGFDPLAPVDVDKLNSAFIHRHQAALLGAHLRV